LKKTALAPRNSPTSELGIKSIPQAPDSVSSDVARALAEDLADGDRTADLIPEVTQLETRVISREQAILAGQPWFDETFRQLDPGIDTHWLANDGDPISPGMEICRLCGPARAILSGERTALNFLQTLSGTAVAGGPVITESACSTPF
jgi:nicotinate-nucleotide pyrophosphorylase (carboxylating)